MTKALDAAVLAAQEQYDEHGADDDVAILAALRAALPAEPTVEMIETMNAAIWVSFDDDSPGERAYRALRAHLLGEDA